MSRSRLTGAAALLAESGLLAAREAVAVLVDLDLDHGDDVDLALVRWDLRAKGKTKKHAASGPEGKRIACLGFERIGEKNKSAQHRRQRR